ncbi:MAG: hypothetical protein CMO80_06615 [Verrucomicrobiales bacterium]|nr:hypothetical protein [Verrucomicrobiales bacterium]|tara:strand:- start:7832 stop:8146 length:315 start_codon:yes stop_codon:yes gene_type:complete
MNSTWEQTKAQQAPARDQIVCHCHQIRASEIQSVIEQDCVETVEDIGRRTNAGTGCGSCQCKIQRLLNGLPVDCSPCGFCDGCGTIRKLCVCPVDQVERAPSAA